MFEANNTRNYKENKIHHVLICDETGIFNAFKKLKEHLGNNVETFVTLIYSVPGNYLNPLFEREITILEKRFSHTLVTYTLRSNSGEYDHIQEFIEAIINSNTTLKIEFLVFGNFEFVDYVSGVLGYFNIETYSIEYYILNQ
jgi:hypothetical protein